MNDKINYKDAALEIRAWTILERNNEKYIVLGFDHENDTSLLAKWLHPVKKDYIYTIVKNLKTDIVVSMKELSKFKILYVW